MKAVGNIVQQNILHRHMGDAFLRLSPFLQNFHSGRKTLIGTVEVVNGRGVAWLLCRVMRFPRTNQKVKLRIDCDHQAKKIDWNRQFNDFQMNSSFYQDGDDLVEHLNGLHLYVKAVEREGDLHYQFHRAKFLGVPIPFIFCPKIIAYEKEVNTECHFNVDVTMWLLGKVIAYGGVISLYKEEDR